MVTSHIHLKNYAIHVVWKSYNHPFAPNWTASSLCVLSWRHLGSLRHWYIALQITAVLQEYKKVGPSTQKLVVENVFQQQKSFFWALTFVWRTWCTSTLHWYAIYETINEKYMLSSSVDLHYFAKTIPVWEIHTWCRDGLTSDVLTRFERGWPRSNRGTGPYVALGCIQRALSIPIIHLSTHAIYMYWIENHWIFNVSFRFLCSTCSCFAAVMIVRIRRQWFSASTQPSWNMSLIWLGKTPGRRVLTLDALSSLLLIWCPKIQRLKRKKLS